MTDDLISRQAAIDAFKKALTVGESKGNYVTICSVIGYKGAKQILESLPSVDAVPVKHGMWRQTVTGWIYCSVCGNEPPGETNSRTDYCPNCGAKMDMKEDGSYEQRDEKAQKGAGAGAPEAEDQGAGAQL